MQCFKALGKASEHLLFEDSIVDKQFPACSSGENRSPDTTPHIDTSSLNELEVRILRDALQKQMQLQQEEEAQRRFIQEEIGQIELKLASSSRVQHNRKMKSFCSICFKAKISPTVSRTCYNCDLRTCFRCGKWSSGEVWLCLLCFKKRQFLVSTGAWFHGEKTTLPSDLMDLLTQLPEAKDNNNQETGTKESEDSEDFQVTTNRDITTSDEESGVPNIRKRRRHTKKHVRNKALCTEYLALPPSGRSLRSSKSGSKYFTPHNRFGTFGASSDSVSGFLSSEIDRKKVGNLSSPITVRSSDLQNTSERESMPCPESSKRPVIERITICRNKQNKKSGGIFLLEPLRKQILVEPTHDGFGLSIVGGKLLSGIMGAYVTNVADCTTNARFIKIGDQVLEWNDKSLVGTTYEQTKQIISESNDEATLAVRHDLSALGKLKLGEWTPMSFEQTLNMAIEKRRASYEVIRPSTYSKEEVSRLINSPTDQPFALSKNEEFIDSQISGQVQFQLWHDPHGNNLIIKLLQARNLALGNSPGQEMPNPYVMIHLLPNRSVASQFRTPTTYQSLTAKWNQTYVYSDVSEEDLPTRSLEVTLWDECREKKHLFMGEVLIDLTAEVLCNEPKWYNLEEHDENSLQLPVPMTTRHTPSDFAKNAKHIPFATELGSVISKKKSSTSALNSGLSRSCSPKLEEDATDSERTRRAYSMTTNVPFRSNRPEYGKSHQRACSQNGKSFTRRETHPHDSSKDSCIYNYRQHNRETWDTNDTPKSEEENNGSTNNLNSSVSSVLTPSISPVSLTVPSQFHPNSGHRTLCEQLSRLSSDTNATVILLHEDGSSSSLSVPNDDPKQGVLGKGQIKANDGEEIGYLQLGLVISCGMLEVDIIKAAGLAAAGRHPDTYAKTYLMVGLKRYQKRKTSTTRHNVNPMYNCKVKYAARDIDGKILQVGVWIRHGLFVRNTPLGEVHIDINRLVLTRKSVSWYKLFPIDNHQTEG